LAEGMECHHALHGALGSLGRPDDPLVLDLLGDLSVPAAAGPQDLSPPVGGGVTGLLRVLYPLGERAEIGEAGPLVVGDPDRDTHVKVLDDVHVLGGPASPSGS